METNRVTVVYKNCQRNLTADIGLLTIDGCRQYIQSTFNQSSLRCDNCGCHRSFHRMVEEETPQTVVIDWQELNRGKNSSVSRPEPIEIIDITGSNYENANALSNAEPSRPTSGRPRPKRYSDGEVDKMMEFADSLGWKMPGRNAVTSERLFKFCEEMGITKMQFKAWLHTHKKSLSPHH